MVLHEMEFPQPFVLPGTLPHGTVPRTGTPACPGRGESRAWTPASRIERVTPRMKVLLFATEAASLKALSRFVSGSGKEVVEAGSLGEALAGLAAADLDAVLLYRDVPPQDGVLVAATANSSPAKPRLVAVIPDQDTRGAAMLEQMGVREVLHGQATRLEILEALEKRVAAAPDLTGFGKVSNTELKTLETLFRDKPENLQGRWLLGFAYYRAGEFEAAREVLEDVCRRAPDNFQAAYYLGSAQYRLGRSDEAVRSWKRVTAGAPGSSQAKKAQRHIDKASVGSIPPMTAPPRS